MLANNIKKARNNKHLSQRALADVIGVSQQTIGSWEVGRTSPDNDMLLKLSKFFGITVDELLESSNNTFPFSHIKEPSKEIHTLTEDERQLIEKYRALDERGKKYVVETAERELEYIIPPLVKNEKAM